MGGGTLGSVASLVAERLIDKDALLPTQFKIQEGIPAALDEMEVMNIWAFQPATM